MRWYYNPSLGADLSKGFETFIKHDDTVDEHLDSLLKTIKDHEQQAGKKIDAQVVTWRGIITKVRSSLHAGTAGLKIKTHSFFSLRSWQPHMTTETGKIITLY